MPVSEKRINELLDRHLSSIRAVDQREAEEGFFYGFHARVGSAVTACGFLVGAIWSSSASQLYEPAEMACQSLIHCLVTCGPSDPEGRLRGDEAIRESIHTRVQQLSKGNTLPASSLPDATVEVLSRVALILQSTGSATLLMDSLEYAEALAMVIQGAATAALLTLVIEDEQALDLSS